MRRSETQLTNAIAELETERRARRQRAPPRRATSTHSHDSDYGKLDWPVDGPLVYTFGRAVQPNNTTIRWNGVGISAATGTPVRSVAPGRVVRRRASSGRTA